MGRKHHFESGNKGVEKKNNYIAKICRFKISKDKVLNELKGGA